MLLAHCRAGFERDCAGEIQARANAAGLPAHVQATAGSARVLLVPAQPVAASSLWTSVDPGTLVFARDCLLAGEELPALPEDRVSALVEAVMRAGTDETHLPFGWLRLETADSDECRPLLPLVRTLERPLASALRAAGVLAAEDDDRQPGLHVHLFASRHARLGMTLPGKRSPWAMGIPRLRAPRGVPSRSARKLEEALMVLPPALQPRAGMRAVDLGAAPGGWSLVLASRGVRVVAVDNGPLKGAAAASALIEHRREDGFRYRPPRAVDWLVCDMVEQPAKVARLVGEWLAEGRCRAAVFNLKLPMKRRGEEVAHCRALLEQAMALAPAPLRLRLRQLYHDRDEVTGIVYGGRH